MHVTFIHKMWRDEGVLTKLRSAMAGVQRTLRERWWLFFNKRCLVGFPWFWPARPPGNDAMVRARRIVRQHFGREHHPVFRLLAQVLAAITWLPAVLMHLWQIRRLEGRHAVPIQRIPGAIWTAMRHNVLPCDYYAYALWRPDRKVNIDNYLYTNEAVRLFKVLNRPSRPDPIGDKLAFSDFCKAHVLPTPEVLAAFTPTGGLVDFGAGRPPEHDLFVKPRVGFGGDGAERFRWRGAAFERTDGSRLSPEELDCYLATRARSENRTLLVQPLLSNHPDLRVHSDIALGTARLVTGRSLDGDVIAIFGFLYFSLDRTNTRHWQVEGLIDVENGQVLTRPVHVTPAVLERHRQLGSYGTLPGWNAVLRHVEVAHRACPNFVFIGWDVAFTNCGPMLLEGNMNWSANTYQVLCGKPLGLTKFSAVLATRLGSDCAQAGVRPL